MTKLLVGMVLSVVSLAACSSSSSPVDSSSSSPVDIAATPLSGVVDGTPWTFQAGATNAFLSEGQTDLFGILHGMSYTPCVDREPIEPRLIVSVPRQPGDYDFTQDRNINFVGADNFNRVTTEGRIVIDSVTATTVTGGLHATFDKSNEVNGRFQIMICQK